MQQSLQSNKPAGKLCGDAWEQKWLGLVETSDAVALMSYEARKFAARWYRNEPEPAMLVLAGTTGTGKTHVANSIRKFASKAAFTSFDEGHWLREFPTQGFYRWPEICDAFKRGDYSCLDDAFTLSLVIIDDIGAEHDPSRNATDKLCQVLSRRERKFTLITTNIEPAAWAERFDIRIADRLMRNSRVVDLTQAESYAIAKHQ